MVPLVLLVHPDPPWSTFSVKFQKVWIRMDWSGPRSDIFLMISSHRELATFQVANLQNKEVILRMSWLSEHNPTIDWNDKRITFNSARCTTWCLKGSHVAYAIPEEKGLEENLIT